MKPGELPAPNAGTAGAAPAAPKPAVNRPTGPDLGERERQLERERRERSAEIIGGLKSQAAGELERSRKATACMQRVLKVHPDQNSPAFQKAFNACMEEREPSGAASAAAVAGADSRQGPPWQPCSEALRSRESTTAVAVEFVNTSSQPRRLYWFDFSGTRQLYGMLQPGQRAPMQTYATHPWMVADTSNTCLGTIVISRDSNRIEVR